MDFYVGLICHFPFDFTPQFFRRCDGGLLDIKRYGALHFLIGQTYGQDDRGNFKLPDLRGKSPLDADQNDCHYFICIEGVFPSRK